MNKKYYWMKLHEDFFDSKEMKKLLSLKNGDKSAIIYLRLLLRSVRTEGELNYVGLEANLPDELALDLGIKPSIMRSTLDVLLALKLIEAENEDKYVLPAAMECIGNDSSSTERVRAFRQRKAAALSPGDDFGNVSGVSSETKDPLLCYAEKKREEQRRYR